MKVKLTNDTLVVEDAGRGKWELVRSLNYGFELRGFDGESALYLFSTGWQSGHHDVVVIHCQCDSKTRMEKRLVEPNEDLNTALNELIKLALPPRHQEPTSN